MKLDIDIPEELQKPHYVHSIGYRIVGLVPGVLFPLLFTAALLSASSEIDIIIIMFFIVMITFCLWWGSNLSLKKQVITKEYFAQYKFKPKKILWTEVDEVQELDEDRGILYLKLNLRSGKTTYLSGIPKQVSTFFEDLQTHNIEIPEETITNMLEFDEPILPQLHKNYIYMPLIIIGFLILGFGQIFLMELKGDIRVLFFLILTAVIAFRIAFLFSKLKCNASLITNYDHLMHFDYPWNQINSLSEIRETKKRFLTWYEMDIETRDGVKTIRTANSDTYPKLVQVKEIFENWQREKS